MRFMLSVCDFCECCTYMKASWQSCTGDTAPRVVNMHGGRVVYMYEEGGLIISDLRVLMST